MNRFFNGHTEVAREQGMALLITLAVITILMTAVLEMNKRSRSLVSSAATYRDKMVLSHMASSAIQMGMALLIQDKQSTRVDSIQEDWANPDVLASLIDEIPFDDGKLSLKISDEFSRLQINALARFPGGTSFNESQRLLWDRFLTTMGTKLEIANEVENTSIINSLKDWLDSGDDDAITGLNGAESDYYQDLDEPYTPRNGPILHISEMLKVKGMSPQLFFGNEQVSGTEGYLTPFGAVDKGGNTLTFEGKININTASAVLIAAMLPVENEDLAQAIVDYREEKTESGYVNDLTNPKWYQNAVGAGGVIIDPKIITNSSDLFRIESTAEIKEHKLTVSAVIYRTTDSKTGRPVCHMVRWLWN